jgi:hypothetical protein
MLVRDGLDRWEIVLQTEHGDLAGRLAAAWSPRPEPFASLEAVARRHDDGWFVWERGPGLDPEGRPAGYLDVPVPLHLSFYRAAIAALTDEDPYAGLILSMHGAGIYRQRYGLQSSLRMRFVDTAAELASQFVAEQEESYPERIHALGIDDAEAWRGYKLLQAWDRLSLYACLEDLDAPAPATIAAVPRDGGEVSLELLPRGRNQVAIDPYPFDRDPLDFAFTRRVLPKREWTSSREFRVDFFNAPVETVTLTTTSR